MAKNEVLLSNAERLYVVDQLTIEEVAQKVGVNERTIRRWKTDHKWDLKKEQYLSTKTIISTNYIHRKQSVTSGMTQYHPSSYIVSPYWLLSRNCRIIR